MRVSLPAGILCGIKRGWKKKDAIALYIPSSTEGWCRQKDFQNSMLIKSQITKMTSKPKCEHAEKYFGLILCETSWHEVHGKKLCFI